MFNTIDQAYIPFWYDTVMKFNMIVLPIMCMLEVYYY